MLLEGHAPEVARRLIGSTLVRVIDGAELRVRIVETEAYHQEDAASHSFNGKTPRTEVMFGPSGHAYVYFTYGMHYCFNIVTGKEGEGSGVLIRAVEPLKGEEIMKTLRVGKEGVELTNGPAKLCQALDITKALNQHDLSRAPLQLIIEKELDTERIVTTTRIGIRKATDVLWRFYDRESRYVSRYVK